MTLAGSRLLCTTLGMFLLAGGTAHAQIVTFTNIANSSGEFQTFSSTAINNSGTVVFGVVTDTSRDAIYTGAGGAPTKIVDDLRPEFDLFGAPVISNNGTVAFVGIREGVRGGIYTGTGGALTTILVSDNGLSPTDVSINSGGDIGFSAQSSTDGEGVFKISGGVITTIASEQGIFANSGFNPNNRFGASAINDSGIVAFTAPLDSDVRGIFKGSGGAVTTIADSNAGFSSFFGSSINNNGTVAFRSFNRPSGTGIYTGDGGAITTIADNSGPFSGFGDIAEPPAINNNGAVAFFAGLDSGGSGIFASLPSSAASFQVVRTGDPLLGSTVASVRLDPFGFNDNNQIAFRYSLANGRQGVAIASIVTPEAGSLLLLAPVLTLPGAVAARRRLRGAAK